MRTPDYNPDLNHPGLTSKPLPGLAPLVITPSSRLHRLLGLAYILFFIACAMLILPYVQVHQGWVILLLLIGGVLLGSWRQEMSQIKVTRCLWIERGSWFLASGSIQTPVSLVGDVIVWPWVIIISVKSTDADKVLRLLVLRDAVSEDDFRRLSCWLRVCLKPRR